jgi:hypothetical protein
LVSAGGDEEAVVVEASDPVRIVLNRGASHGVEAGHEFLIYDLSAEELEDPESGDSLGRLERVKGTGVVINVQERMCTVELDHGYPARKRVGRKSAFQAFPGLEAEEPQPGSPSRPEVGDRAKPLP